MGYWRGSDSWELSVTFGSESWTTRGPPQSQLYLSVTVTEEQLDTRREPLAAPAPAWSCSSALLSGLDLDYMMAICGATRALAGWGD